MNQAPFFPINHPHDTGQGTGLEGVFSPESDVGDVLGSAVGVLADVYFIAPGLIGALIGLWLLRAMLLSMAR